MKLIRVCLICALLGVVIGFSSCGKKESAGASVKFTTTTGSYGESDGTVNVGVTLSSVQSQAVTVNYTWASSDTTTFLGGDFTFGTPSSITIPAGQTSGNIQVVIIDDTQIDGQDIVNLTLSGANNGVAVSGAADKNFTLTIADNDVAPVANLQVDLTWHLADVTADINAINLDLYLQDSVVIGSSGITDIGKPYKASAATTGFETLIINAGDVDQIYYIAIPYISGTNSVTFTFVLNGFAGEYAGNFGGGDYPAPTATNGVLGSALFFGSFTKSGSSFGYSGRTATPSNPRHSKVLEFRVSDFIKKK